MSLISAERAGAEKDKRYALYLIPPYRVSKNVMEVHQMLQKQYGFTAAARFQVHATVKGFFKKNPGGMESLLESLDEVMLLQKPFPVYFSGFRNDEIGVGLNLSLDNGQPNRDLYDFRERVVDEIRPHIASDCDFVSSDLGNPYEAHITLAFRDISPAIYDDVLSYLEEAPIPNAPFVAKNFHFLEFISEDWSGEWWKSLNWRLLKVWRLQE